MPLPRQKTPGCQDGSPFVPSAVHCLHTMLAQGSLGFFCVMFFSFSMFLYSLSRRPLIPHPVSTKTQALVYFGGRLQNGTPNPRNKALFLALRIHRVAVLFGIVLALLGDGGLSVARPNSWQGMRAASPPVLT